MVLTIAHELGRGVVVPQDHFGFALAPFFELMGIGFKCIIWVSSANLPFIFLLSLFTLNDTNFDFL